MSRRPIVVPIRRPAPPPPRPAAAAAAAAAARVRLDPPGPPDFPRVHQVRLNRAAREVLASDYIVPTDNDPDPDLRIVENYGETLPEVLQHPAVDTDESNFYVLPIQAITYMHHFPDLIEGVRNPVLCIPALQRRLNALPLLPPDANLSFITDRLENPYRNHIQFIEKSFRGFRQHLTEDSIYPWLGPGNTLIIPSWDVRDLPIYLMLYIWWKLINLPPGHSTFYVLFSLTPEAAAGGGLRHLITNFKGQPVKIYTYRRRRVIKMESIRAIYMTLLREFSVLIPAVGSARAPYAHRNYYGTWMGSDDSGTRIILHNIRDHTRLVLNLIFHPVPAQSFGTAWTPEIELLLTKTIGDSVMSVRNRNDNKCLLYCVVMGLLTKCRTDAGSKRVFGVSPMMVDDYEVFSKGCYAFSDDSPISQLTRRLARLLLVPQYSLGTVDDPLKPFLEKLDDMISTKLAIDDFREEFEKIEHMIIPDSSICGIDVYGMDFNLNVHVYPLYISKSREHVIELLCITPKDSDTSHFCLITNMEKLMKRSGGKQFYSCSKCGKAFYHKHILNQHMCPFASTRGRRVMGDAGGGYHYSKIGCSPQIDIEVGFCPKCRLAFVTDFEYTYHMEHCLMKGQTGYRHVQLASYDVAARPKLEGVAFDAETEEKHVKSRRMMYADFECSIDPQTGVHTFMSYGIYDWQLDEYECGYDPQGFFDFILSRAFSHPEENIYVYFHNAMGYDANFIMRYVLKTPEYSDWGIQVIMKSSNRLQKLVFFVKRGDEKKQIHICDSFMFLTLSLERIVGSIRKDDLIENEKNFGRFFQVMKRRYPGVPDKDIDHILRKNIFPYRFFTDSSKLDVLIDDFLAIFQPLPNNLGYFGERVTLDDLAAGYGDTETVIHRFGCQTARDYHDLYLCCDVMQLADVFDRSMNILWESHHIHLTKYLGMPSASWAAFLRHDPTLSIPLYENTFFAEFFKAMIRGGITSAATRHAIADEKHSIIYLDVNGLYPYVMQAYDYPCGQFVFRPMGWKNSECRVRLFELFRNLEEAHKGMCFCVDMHFPDEVKRLTDMYPFAPEHRQIYGEYYQDASKNELTPFLQRWSEANENEKMAAFDGLVCTLYDKEKYNVHWRLLKFYMEHGVEIKKVYFAVEFDEGPYLAGYIRKNIEIRNGRKDELGKTLYKLLGNSIYGKTFESPFKRNTYEIIRDPTKLEGLLSEGNISAVLPVDDLAWIVKMDGEEIVLDKPTYIGACVVEYAKLHMYTLLYDKLMKIFPNVSPDDLGCEMLYTDTDSFIVRVRHPDGVGTDPEELFSYIKQCDPTLIGGIGGQVKSETGNDDTIEEYIGLRSKVYIYRTKKGHIGKRAKGTTHDAQEMQLDWDVYKQALESLTSVNTRNLQFIRKVFKISSIDVFRKSLSVNDGKRYICEDGIHTHAFGHPSIPSPSPSPPPPHPRSPLASLPPSLPYYPPSEPAQRRPRDDQ